MNMKRTFRKFFALSAAIMMAATFTACSNEGLKTFRFCLKN